MVHRAQTPGQRGARVQAESGQKTFRQLDCRVREIRKLRGWSQEDFARRLGVEASTVSRMERGLSEPGIVMALTIAQILDVGLRVLWPLETIADVAQLDLVTELENERNRG